MVYIAANSGLILSGAHGDTHKNIAAILGVPFYLTLSTFGSDFMGGSIVVQLG